MVYLTIIIYYLFLCCKHKGTKNRQVAITGIVWYNYNVAENPIIVLENIR